MKACKTHCNVFPYTYWTWLTFFFLSKVSVLCCMKALKFCPVDFTPADNFILLSISLLDLLTTAPTENHSHAIGSPVTGQLESPVHPSTHMKKHKIPHGVTTGQSGCQSFDGRVLNLCANVSVWVLALPVLTCVLVLPGRGTAGSTGLPRRIKCKAWLYNNYKYRDFATFNHFCVRNISFDYYNYVHFPKKTH